MWTNWDSSDRAMATSTFSHLIFVLNDFRTLGSWENEDYLVCRYSFNSLFFLSADHQYIDRTPFIRRQLVGLPSYLMLQLKIIADFVLKDRFPAKRYQIPSSVRSNHQRPLSRLFSLQLIFCCSQRCSLRDVDSWKWNLFCDVKHHHNVAMWEIKHKMYHTFIWAWKAFFRKHFRESWSVYLKAEGSLLSCTFYHCKVFG